ncbi:MAG: hypothetical protein KA155_08995 [Alphaproteobacteria bacterium]|jgi:hypothetical protein|nr:hypothetical protein [Alphaproteobacteria bacterium]
MSILDLSNADMNSQEAEKALTAERYPELMEAVESLYIRNNISGRNMFTLAWPEAAQLIFGEELSRFDRIGTHDKERRAVLEIEADDRRIEMLDMLKTIEAKSVVAGILQADYVQGAVVKMGRKLALDVYSRWIVDRFIEPPPEERTVPVVESVKIGDLVVEARASVPLRRPPPAQADSMEHIRPISVEPPPPEVQEELIKDTQGGGMEIRVAAPVQESVAPVLGVTKRPGLKIMSIAETGSADQDKKQGNQ